MSLDAYTRHESDPAPAYLVRVDDTASPYLPFALWYVAEWTTDPALFNSAMAFGRTADNFHPLDTQAHVRMTNERDHVVGLPEAVWRRFLADAGNRRVYLRVGVGTDPNPASASWVWKELAYWEINHDPVANAGDTVHVDLTGGSVDSDVVLDASRSSDPDPGTQLSYEWSLVRWPDVDCFLSGGQLISTMQQALQAGGERVTLIPAGTAVSQDCRGVYEIELAVSDDDPPSFYGTTGRDVTRLLVVVGAECSSGVCIESPTGERQAFVEEPGEDRVRIHWRLSGALATAVHSAPGARLKLTIRASDAAPGDPPVWVDWEFRPGVSGTFAWSGMSDEGAPVPTGFYDLEVALLDQDDQPLPASEPTTATAERAVGVSRLGFWADLVSHRPPHAVQARANEPLVAGFYHAIENAFYDATNLDYFPVRITQMPVIGGQQVSPPQLLEHIRLNFNDFVDTGISEFGPYGDDQNEAQRWQASPLGALLGIDMFLFTQIIGPDDGSVACSEHGPERWRFSTLFTLYDSNHPVSGNREWSLVANPDGSHTFYTKAADRATTAADVPAMIYPIGTKLWESLQAKTVAFVNQNGGTATAPKPTVLRASWAMLERMFHNPTVSWRPGVLP